MVTEYIIFEDGVHAQVFLVQAINEAQAWKLYLERERNYAEQPDGTYRSGPFSYERLESVFSAYGIIPHGDGSYSDTDGLYFRSLEEVKLVYGIEEQGDGSFVVHDKTYPNLAEALRKTVGHHHIEIASCSINYLAPIQTLYVSKDKWDYVEMDTPEDLKSDIISQHLWQSERYKTLGQLQDAVAELKKALRLAASRKERLHILLDLTWLLNSLGQFSATAKYYREALRITTEFDNEAWIRYRLAGVYEDMGQPTKALWHYNRVLADELDDEDSNELKKRIAALKQANSTTTA